MTIVLMYIIRSLTKKTIYGEGLFKQPKKNAPPPLWIRTVLILTCTSVSFSHGSNDGQKGVGLVMLILIGIVPSYFALKISMNPSELIQPLKQVEQIVSNIDTSPFSATDRAKFEVVKTLNAELQEKLAGISSVEAITRSDRFLVRKDILILDRDLRDLLTTPEMTISKQHRDT